MPDLGRTGNRDPHTAVHHRHIEPLPQRRAALWLPVRCLARRRLLDSAGLIALAATPDALLARIETLLLALPMSAALRSSLLSIHTAYAGSPTEQVQNILGALCSVPEFVVER